MDSELSDAPVTEDGLPDINQNSRRRRVSSGSNAGRRGRPSREGSDDPKAEEGINHEYTIEAVESVGWDELKLVFDVKWKLYSRDHNSKEPLSSLVCLLAPYKYLTEVVPHNEESDCFKIFAGLHKSGYRFHTSDDRFLFCVKKERLINADYCKPYLHVFDSADDRNKRLSEYNLRLHNVDGPFVFKVVNEEDLSMPNPFFGVNILNRAKGKPGHLPLFTQRKEMTIFRTHSVWSLRTESALEEGSTLFEMGGKPCDPKYASYHMKDMGELLAFSHFVYLGKDVYFGKELSLDRRGVFDAASCIAHSCDPNCKMVWNMQSNQVTVVARRKIEVGEEISLDYFSENKKSMTKRQLIARLDRKMDCVECYCSSVDCRIVLWLEDLKDHDHYEYPKEYKLEEAKDEFYKGVRFNTE